MKEFLIVFRLELLKLRRTLGLWMTIAAPLIVVIMQTLISIRRGLVSQSGLDPWLAFFGNAYAMWAVFMQPLLIALVVALVYHADHAHHGWHRMFTLPVPRWTIPAAKSAVVLALLGISTVSLVLELLLGVRIAELVRHEAVLPVVPWGEILSDAARLTVSSLLVLALQNAVSLRWSSMTLSLGVGIAGAFIAISAAGWERGYLFPWLMALYSLHGPAETIHYPIVLSCVGATLVFAATFWYAARRDPGLY